MAPASAKTKPRSLGGEAPRPVPTRAKRASNRMCSERALAGPSGCEINHKQRDVLDASGTFPLDGQKHREGGGGGARSPRARASCPAEARASGDFVDDDDSNHLI